LTFNRGLDAIAGRRPLDNALLILIQQAETRGVLPRLIGVTRQYYADPENLQVVTEALNLDEGKGKLERCLFDSFPPADVGQWRKEMMRCERAVCRLETRTGRLLGTGTLIGPDQVVTNRHVIDWFVQSKVPPADIRARFDYKSDDQGGAALAGIAYGPAPSPVIADSPKDNLDYALIRLAVKAGEEKVPAKAEERRGWVVPDHHDFRAGEPLAIIQHPKGDPMKFAFGAVTAVKSSPARIEYGINTEGGSSGAPCFTPDWRLVGLHRSGSKEHNTGVPWSAIIADLTERGIPLSDPP
jgi:V8-like Glu-specific endopeptidase